MGPADAKLMMEASPGGFSPAGMAGAAVEPSPVRSTSNRSLGGGSVGGSTGGGASGGGSVGRRSSKQRQSGKSSSGGSGDGGGYKAPKPRPAPGKGTTAHTSIVERAATRAKKMALLRQHKEPSTILDDVPEWQPTSNHVNARGMRPDITPFGRNPKLYKFRDAPPSSKGWGLAAGDELGSQFDKLDVTPSGNNRFHSFRDAPPTSNGWHLVAGDELIKTEVKVDTTPLGSNIKNFRFRSNGKRKFNVVKKTAKPLISYFE